MASLAAFTADWYYLDAQGQQKGPHDVAGLRALWNQEITEHSYAWREGMAGWVTLSDPACAALLAQLMSAADGGAAVIKARSRGHSMSNEGQAEFFLRKFAKHENVERAAVFKLMEEFNKFDLLKQGELEEDQAMRLLESRGETRTFQELRAMVEKIDLDKNRKLSFLEWACAVFGKTWEELHREVKLELKRTAEQDEADAKARDAENAREVARLEQQLADAKLGAEQDAARAQLKAKMDTIQAQKDEEAAAAAAKEEAKRKEAEYEATLTGVKKNAAFFKHAIENAGEDKTATNEQLLKAEAAKRKAAKEAAAAAAAAEKKALEEAALARAAAEAAEREAAARAEAAEHEIAAAAADALARAEKEKNEKIEAERAAYESARLAAEAKAAEEAARKKAEADEARARLAAKRAAFEKK